MKVERHVDTLSGVTFASQATHSQKAEDVPEEGEKTSQPPLHVFQVKKQFNLYIFIQSEHHFSFI